MSAKNPELEGKEAIVKQVKDTIKITQKITEEKGMSKREILQEIEMLQGLMKIAATSLDFETAIELRDRIAALKAGL